MLTANPGERGAGRETLKPLEEANLARARKTLSYYLTVPAVRVLARTPVTPNAITWSGFVLAVGAAALIAFGHLFAAGWVVLLAGFLDIVDGALARESGRVTRFGGVLDSTLDRLSEAVLLIGILLLYAADQSLLPVLLVGLCLAGSFLVSYVRARAEAIGLQCQVGVFTRGERVVALVLGLWLNQVTPYALLTAMALIMVFSFITVAQRLLYVWQQTRTKQS